MTAMNWVTLAVTVVALGMSLAAYIITQRTWLTLAKTARLQAETWAMLDRYDLAEKARADADLFEWRAWLMRSKAARS